MNKNFKNNKAEITGLIVDELTYSHSVRSERFFTFTVAVSRPSNTIDLIPVLISEKIINIHDEYIGYLITVIGEFRSYNKHYYDTENFRLVLNLFAKDFELLDELPEDKKNNMIDLTGYICKEPTYRLTPYGKEISDFLLAVHTTEFRSDYIPCIAWNYNARFISSLTVGCKIRLLGRIQSREYNKQIDENTSEKRTAIEISAYRIILL